MYHNNKIKSHQINPKSADMPCFLIPSATDMLVAVERLKSVDIGHLKEYELIVDNEHMIEAEQM